MFSTVCPDYVSFSTHTKAAMARTLRQRKRPASPEAEPDPPKKTRQTKKTPIQVDSDSEIEEVKPKKAPAKAKGKTKVKAQDDDVDTDLPTPKANGKAKTEFKTTIPEDATAGSAQYAKAERLVVPVDETCPFNGQVYIDSDGIIYDASLNQTNAGANANKVCC